MHTVNANERFTTKGYSYHHSYAVSICGHPYQPSLCVNNATTDVRIKTSIFLRLKLDV